MGRKPRIEAGAKPTTVSLTRAQKAAIRKLQTNRLDAGEQEPLLNEVVLEGLELLLRKEGWTPAELECVFPKREVVSAVLKQFPRGRSSRGA